VRGLVTVLSAVLATGCAVTPPGPLPAPGATTPEPIELRHFFASREANWGYRISPDRARSWTWRARSPAPTTPRAGRCCTKCSGGSSTTTAIS